MIDYLTLHDLEWDKYINLIRDITPQHLLQKLGACSSQIIAFLNSIRDDLMKNNILHLKFAFTILLSLCSYTHFMPDKNPTHNEVGPTC